MNYPCLQKDKFSSLVVLFTSPDTGTVVVPDAGWNVGDVVEGWDESGFTPLPDGSQVTITQGAGTCITTHNEHNRPT